MGRYTCAYPNAISFSAGDRLTTGKTDPEYPGWIWVTTEDGDEGWAPLSFLQEPTGQTSAVRHYTAKELTVETGDTVETLHKLNGWCWVRDRRGEEGWIPMSTLGE